MTLFKTSHPTAAASTPCISSNINAKVKRPLAMHYSSTTLSCSRTLCTIIGQLRACCLQRGVHLGAQLLCMLQYALQTLVSSLAAGASLQQALAVFCQLDGVAGHRMPAGKDIESTRLLPACI